MQRIIAFGVCSALTSVLYVGPAHAGSVLETPPVYADTVGVCLFLNIKPKPVDGVIIEMLDQDGASMVSIGPISLNPNDERLIGFDVSGADYFYCRATRTTGGLSTSKTLLTACQRDSFDAFVDPCDLTATTNK